MSNIVSSSCTIGINNYSTATASTAAALLGLGILDKFKKLK